MKHVIEYVLAVGIGGFLRLFPRRVRLAFGRALGSLVFALDRRHRDITIDNVSRAYRGDKSDGEKRAIAEGAFRHFGGMLLELITLGTPSASKLEGLVELEGVDVYEKARARGAGVILTTGHFGNWELHGIAHGYRLGNIHVLARRQDNRYLNDWLEEIRTASGNVVVYKRNALAHMRRLLKRGETVALVIDQNVHLEDAVFIDFFGRKAATTPVPAWFALRTGAALMPAFCFPLPDGRYRAVYTEPIDCERYRHLGRDEAILAITQALARVQESYIREHPDCWLWMHRRWRTRPPEESEATAPAATDEHAVDDSAAVPELR